MTKLIYYISTVPKSESDKAPLRWGGMGDSHHGLAADKSAVTVRSYHMNVFSTFFNVCY